MPGKAGGEHDWHRGTGEGTDAFCRLSWPLDTTQSKLQRTPRPRMSANPAQ